MGKLADGDGSSVCGTRRRLCDIRIAGVIGGESIGVSAFNPAGKAVRAICTFVASPTPLHLPVCRLFRFHRITRSNPTAMRQTVGGAFDTLMIRLDGKTQLVQFWDSAGNGCCRF
jgi:hypothetical protein